MRRQQNVIRFIFMVSLILHLAVFLNMRGTILSARSYRDDESVQADIVRTSQSIPIPPADYQPPKIDFQPQTSKRQSNLSKKLRNPLPKSSPTGASANAPPQRAVITKFANENEAEIPVLDNNTRIYGSLPSLSSSAGEAKGASSQGKGMGDSSGSGRGGGAGGIISLSPRDIIKRDVSIGEKFQIYKPEEMPFVKGLGQIADHVTNTSKTRKVDIVFIVDTSESMEDNINGVRKHLNLMISTFQKAGLDFTLGVVRFHHSAVYEWLGMDIVISKQTKDVEEIKQIMKSIRVSGGERALDAIMRAIDGVEFRPGAERHFILLTDEYVHGTYPVAEVLKAAKRANIVIDVLGRDEPFQRAIAEQTGGLWASIEEIK